MSKATKAKQIRAKLKRIWAKHKFSDNPPLAIQKMARELCNRLQIPITVGKKLAQCVIDFDEGITFNASPRKVATPKKDEKTAFYASWAWRTLRMEVLKEFGARCMCCGATPDHKDMSGNPVKIVVDHIKPIHNYWSLRLKKSNLQVLCDECNQGKGAWDQTDHRPSEAPDEWIVDEGVGSSIIEQLTDRTTWRLN